MAIQIRFDPTGNAITPTLLLAKKSGEILGMLDPKSIVLHSALNEASEITFDIYKELNGVKTHLWDEILDFRLIWCKEWNKWFEITMSVTEEFNTVKTITCTSLGEAELGQIMLFDVEINTENDILRDDYEIPTLLYYPEHPEASLLDRILEKAPHYTVKHVDYTVMSMQRMFTFDGKSIYDAFQEIAEECSVLFQIDVETNNEGGLSRTISVYDLESYCNSCEHRGYFEETCPECGSTDIHSGYGEDTTIFITSDELGNEITFETNTDEVKNCFKLEGGDDLMTATIRNCNPNGTEYSWHISDQTKKDMSSELIERLESYDEKYFYYLKEHSIEIEPDILEKYNSIMKKYKEYNEDLEPVESPIIGYSDLITLYYDVVDMELYLRDSLMPDVSMAETNATEQLGLLNSTNLSPVAISNKKYSSASTVDSAVLSMAKTIVRPNFQVKIVSSTYDDEVWNGRFKVTNYSDEEDTATNEYDITVTINDDYTTFVKQRIDRCLYKEDDKDAGIVKLFNLELEEFTEELKKYCLVLLTTYHDACQTCLDILVEQGAGDKSTWEDEEINEGQEDIYNNLYLPFYDKLNAIEYEMSVRQQEIDTIVGVYDNDMNVLDVGMKTFVVSTIEGIQSELDFQKYLGDELWLEFSTFRREDKYQNENYVSDGLTNAELIQNAQEFLEVAAKEIYKSAELQHTISGDLKNFLSIERFSPIVDYFEVGNWIRVRIDDEIYKLQLLDYKIDFDNFENIEVTFSDVIKDKDGCYSVKSILDQAQTMATSYDSVKKQAGQGSDCNDILSNWFESGLDATTTKIVNNATNVSMSWDNHGMLFRKYDDYLEEFEDEQLKIINSTIAITDDKWETTKTAIGRFLYRDSVSGKLVEAYGVNGETVVGKFILGKNLAIYNNDMTFKVNEKGIYLTNGTNTVTIDPSEESLFTITNEDGEDVISMTEDGDANFVGHINAKSLSAGGKISKDANSNGLFVDERGNLYSGYNNQVTIYNDGTFNLANDGIVYKDDKLTINGNLIAQTLTAGEKISSEDKNDGLFIDKDGTIYSGKYNSVIIYSNGQFNLGNDGIIFDGTNVTLGSNVVVTWDNLSDEVATTISKNDIATATISANQIYAGAMKSTDMSTTIIDLDDGTFSFANGKLKYEDEILSVNGQITATTLTATEFGQIACWQFDSAAIYKGSSEFGNSSGMYFGTNGLSLGDSFTVTSGGKLVATSAEITGKITASSGQIGGDSGFTISENAIYSNGHSSYNSSVDGVYLGNDYMSFGSGGATYFYKDGTFSLGNGSIVFNGDSVILSSDVAISWAQVTDKPDDIGGLTESEVTTITNNAISTSIIKANQVAIGDYENYATVNPNSEDTMVPTDCLGGTKIGSNDSDGNAAIEKPSTSNANLPFCDYTPLKLVNGDTIYYEFNLGNYDSSNRQFYFCVWFFDSDKNYVSVTNKSFTVSAKSWKFITDSVTIPSGKITSGIKYFVVGIYDENGIRFGVSQIYVKKKTSGSLIVDGTITATQLTAENIVGTNGWINLSKGTFNYGNGALEWDGESMKLVGGIISPSDSGTCYVKDGHVTILPDYIDDPSSYEGDDYVTFSLDTLTMKYPGSYIYVNGQIETGDSFYCYNFGTGLKFRTNDGEAGISCLSDGTGIYLWDRMNDENHWNTSVCLVDPNIGVNIVPKTGGTFYGEVTFDKNVNIDGNIYLKHNSPIYGKSSGGNNYRIARVGESSAGTDSDTVNCVVLGNTDLRTYVLAHAEIYMNHAVNNYSDERLKKNFEVLDERYLSAFDKLEPVLYHWNEQENTESKSTGYKAQSVLKALEDSGIEFGETNIVSKSYEDVTFSGETTASPHEIYSLQYEGIDVMAVYALQDARKRITYLEKEIAKLKETIKKAGL